MMLHRTVIVAGTLSLSFLMLALVLPAAEPARAQLQSSGSQTPSKKAEYVGITKCAACHFNQYKDWKTSVHGQAFEILPVKYRKDAACLKCHTTGIVDGQQAIVGDGSAYQHGVSCESCHGPGSEHANRALQLVNEQITEEALTSLRGKIRRLDMRQCVDCHITKAHKQHPPFDRETALPRPRQKQSASFFQSVHDGGSAKAVSLEPKEGSAAPR